MNTSQKKLWNTGKPNNELVEKLTKILDCHPLTAKLLVNRAICSIPDIKNFLSPDFNNITPPWKLKDIKKASERIYRAIIRQENILIFGDYDSDGVTSVSVLYLFLRPYVKNLFYFIPHREKDGYGFSENHVEIFAQKNISLIITVDCGSSSHQAIKEAKRNRIDTIVTDHHQIPSIPETAYAVVNPHREDCTSGLEHLAGVGVAFYLIMQLRIILRENNFFKSAQEPNLMQFLDFVAVGTIADLVPMIKENRIFTKKGLNLIRENKRESIKELIKVSGLNSSFVTSQDISFSVAPRLNSAGRIDHAAKCVELLCSSDRFIISEICSELDKLNSKRKEMENEIILDISKKIIPQYLNSKILIFQSTDWLSGILGTAAAKIVAKYNYPCILFSASDNLMKGSARSIPGFSIYELLAENRELIERFGGHSQAAGLTISSGQFKNFCKSIEKSALEKFSTNDFTPVHQAEDVVLFDELSATFLNEMELLEPFGVKNPYPLFIAKNVIIENHTKIKNIHSRMTLFQPNCIKQNRLTGFIFNNNDSLPSQLNQILLKPVPDKTDRTRPNLFIEAWQ